ncbi:LLM class F420-dependent oxidoreductase [uncultured Jatrophihabitans sp.]|uniref:LLM class F420-dependent oxidoreductase n=1 Tax=uncultured Jatrophihabitans sp. TaxID=1610747 RepID=UPI0035CB687F
MNRWGLTIPLLGVPLPAHAEIIRALPDLGYTDVWSAETNGTDAFTPLALASAWEPTLRLGTAIVPVYTRGPALIAMSAASMAAAAPGRFVLGLGASSPVIVGDWNGIPFEQPFRRTRDVLRTTNALLSGERVTGDFDTISVHRFKLDQAPNPKPLVLVAALRAQMLRLAGRESDGAILNWLASYDVAQCLAEVHNGARQSGGDAGDIEVVARIFVCPTDDVDYARALGRTLISTYLTVPAYAAFHDWLGRGEQLKPMHEAWAAGDRKGAAAAIPDEVVDDLVLHGSPVACRDQVQAYVDAGVKTPVMMLLPTTHGAADLDLLRALGPEA